MRLCRSLALILPLLPVVARSQLPDHAMAPHAMAGMAMPAMTMPAMPMPGHAVPQKDKRKPAASIAVPTVKRSPQRRSFSPAAAPADAAARPVDAGGAQTDPHAGHHMPTMDHDGTSAVPMPGMVMPAGAVPAPPMEPTGEQSLASTSGTALPAGHAPAPAPPADHYADRVYDPAAMSAARRQLSREHGGSTFTQVMVDLAEYRVGRGYDAFHWDGEGWFGGDIDRLVVKTEGEGTARTDFERAEFQAVYSRAIDPYWNVQAGVRRDFGRAAGRAYATVGIEGLAPYWFKLDGALFLSSKGDLLARVEGYNDMRVTQRLVLQPRIELNFAAQDVASERIGSGLSDAELGVRLRYEATREFAPYVGISYDRKSGDTARFARRRGEEIGSTDIVFGARFWF